MISRTTIKWQMAAAIRLLHLYALETTPFDAGTQFSDDLIQAMNSLRESTEALRRELYTKDTKDKVIKNGECQ